MHPLLAAALADAAPLIAERQWTTPSDAALADGERLLAWVAAWREPVVEVDPDGALSFAWEAAELGWVTLSVRGDGQLTHAAVIGADEFGQTEPFGGDALPPWAAEVLTRLLRQEH